MCNIKYLLTIFIFQTVYSVAFGQYKKVAHRELQNGEVPVAKPGNYARPGTVYVLTNDISSSTSPVFLGKDVILDLNGYTIKFGAGKYAHIANSGFEDGLKGWDVSKAPGAKIENTEDVHVFLGKKLLSLQAGDVVTSPYIYLPLSDRSYFAMCGITGRFYHDAKHYPEDEMKVSVYVEDEKGNEVKCITEYADTTLVNCPVEKKQPRLGGGFVYAHLNKLPAGKYRVRIKADTDCLVDEIDIRPAMDVGISIVEKTYPMAHYDQITRESYPPVYPAFFDYTGDVANRTPVSSVPKVEGEGSVIIKNGIIESGFDGILGYGIQSSALKVKVILDNVNIKVSGMNATAAELQQASITHCRFDANVPFLIQRHSMFEAVNLRGNDPSEVSYSEFYGGQGCLSFQGKNSSIHHNYFVNHQTVTNHYSIMGSGIGSKIFDNRIEPEVGSGVWAGEHIDVFNNVIKIKTSPPTCEYGHEEYSTAAVRMADYHHKYGEDFYGNRVYNNKIYITALSYPSSKQYIPMSWGIYYSVSGGDNYVFGNDITVNKVDTASKALAAAFYICGGEGYGGQFHDNRITTNVPAAWIATFYGGASNSKIYNNTIIPLNHAKFQTFRMGWAGCNDCVQKSCAECIARNIQFRSNNIVGQKFNVGATDQEHSYSVYWTLQVKAIDQTGRPVKGVEVFVRDKNGSVVEQMKTDGWGMMKTELPEYSANGKERKYFSPFVLHADGIEKKVVLNNNMDIEFTVPAKKD